MQTQYSDCRINDLMSVLHHGQDNATSRSALASTMNMSDRNIRKLIETARDEGCLILNCQDGRGYYLPDSIADIEKQYRQDTNRAMSILKRRKHMRKILKENGVKV